MSMDEHMSLPDAITSPVAWTGRDMMAAPERWTYRLSDADVAEIENAATIFIDSGRPLGQITRDLFPLPEFGVWLESLRETLIHGIGFQLITGLPVETYSGDMRATIFCGIGSHIGRPDRRTQPDTCLAMFATWVLTSMIPTPESIRRPAGSPSIRIPVMLSACYASARPCPEATPCSPQA